MKIFFNFFVKSKIKKIARMYSKESRNLIYFDIFSCYLVTFCFILFISTRNGRFMLSLSSSRSYEIKSSREEFRLMVHLRWAPFLWCLFSTFGKNCGANLKIPVKRNYSINRANLRITKKDDRSRFCFKFRCVKL